MRAYSTGIKAKTDDNLAGQILSEFGLINIADEYPSLLEEMSLEHIVARDSKSGQNGWMCVNDTLDVGALLVHSDMERCFTGGSQALGSVECFAVKVNNTDMLRAYTALGRFCGGDKYFILGNSYGKVSAGRSYISKLSTALACLSKLVFFFPKTLLCVHSIFPFPT